MFFMDPLIQQVPQIRDDFYLRSHKKLLDQDIKETKTKLLDEQKLLEDMQSNISTADTEHIEQSTKELTSISQEIKTKRKELSSINEQIKKAQDSLVKLGAEKKKLSDYEDIKQHNDLLNKEIAELQKEILFLKKFKEDYAEHQDKFQVIIDKMQDTSNELVNKQRELNDITREIDRMNGNLFDLHKEEKQLKERIKHMKHKYKKTKKSTKLKTKPKKLPITNKNKSICSYSIKRDCAPNIPDVYNFFKLDNTEIKPVIYETATSISIKLRDIDPTKEIVTIALNLI